MQRQVVNLLTKHIQTGLRNVFLKPISEYGYLIEIPGKLFKLVPVLVSIYNTLKSNTLHNNL